MKKLFALLVALVGTLGLMTSCRTKTETPTPETPEVTPTPTQPEVSEDLQKAKEFVKSIYQASEGNVTANMDRAAKVPVNGKEFTVSWAVTVKSGKTDAVSVAKAEDGSKYVVSVTYNNTITEEVKFTLTATITSSDNESVTLDFEYTIPKFKTLSYAEFAALDDDASCTVEGIVTGVLSKTNGDASNGLYVNGMNNDGGFYVYNMTNDPVTDGIEAGMKVMVSGQKDDYNGTLEIVNPSVTVVDETKATVTPVDLTSAYTSAEALTDESLVGKQALLVTVKGATITTAEESSGYYKFKLGELESYVRISSSVCPLNAADTATFKEEFAKHSGWTANVTGVVCVYNDAFYLTPVTVDAFEYLSLPERSDAEQVAYEKEGLTLSTTKVSEDVELTVPVAGKSYTGVTISWASNSAQAVVDNSTGKITVTLGEEAATIKLTATITKGESSDTKEFELQVSAAVKDVYVTTPIENPVAGTFVIVMDTTALAEGGKVYYFNGELSDKGALKTTTNIGEAADVVVEVVDGGYALKVGTKYLEGYLNGTYKNIRFADTAKVWKWNADAKVFTCDIEGVAYYFGDRDRGGYSNDTMALSDIKYITGDNLSKIGVSQFVGAVSKKEIAVPQLKPITEPVAGSFFVAMDTTALAEGGKVYYFNGELSDKGALKTTTNLSEAVEVVVEVVDGGYALKVGTKYLEGYLNGTYKNIRFADTAKVWKWNADAKVFTCDIEGVAYYFGDRDRGGYSNDTMALSDIKYITGDNLSKIGVSQFVGQFGTIEYVAPSTPSNPDTDEPENPSNNDNESGYTVVEEIEVDTAYKLGLVSGGKTYYFTGVMSGFYGATSTDVTKGVDVKLEATTGGYYLYFVDSSDTKQYINIETSGTHINFVFRTTAATVWTWNTELKAVTGVVEGTTYFMGTYDTYNTFGMSSIDKAPTSYVGQFYINEDDIHTHTPATEWTTDATHHWHACTGTDCTELLDKAEHTWGNWEEVTPATETTKGSEKRACSVCLYEETREIAELGHTHVWATEWTTDGENHWYACSGCAETKDLAAHAGGEATCKDKAVCTVCGESYGALSTTHTGGTATCKDKAVCTVCGESYGALSTTHEYEDGVCTVCEAKDPNYVWELTIPEILAAADGTKIKLTAIVMTIDTPYDSYYGNITVTVGDLEGNVIQAFRLKGDCSVGDKIVITGEKDIYNNTTHQIAAGATFEKVNNYTDAEKVWLDTKNVEAPASEVSESFELIVESVYGSTISWSSNNDAITIDGSNANVTQGDEDVQVVLTAKISSNEESKELTFTVTVKKTGSTAAIQETVTIKYSGSTTTNMDGTNQATLLGADASIFTIVGKKDSGNNNNVGLAKAGELRLYKGGNTIEVTSTCNIVSIKINTTATTFKVLDASGNVVTGTNGVYNINGLGFSVTTSGGVSSSTVAIKSIEITYLVSAA